jgi:hypothetical protein
MEKVLSILVTTLILAASAYSPQESPANDTNPGCIVLPEVIQACEESGGRFDYQVCSCVGGAELS